MFIIARERGCENAMEDSYLISSVFTKNKLNISFLFLISGNNFILNLMISSIYYSSYINPLDILLLR